MVTPERLRPGQERGSLRTSVTLFITLVITFAGLHVVLQGAAWWFQLAFLCALLLGVAAVVRRISRRRWLPPLVAALVLIATITVFFAPDGALLGIVPTGETLGRFGDLADAANFSISRQSVPAEAVPSITFLLCLGVGVIAVVADGLANALRTPALAGIPLLVLLAVPSIVTIDSTDPVVFVLAALSYLALLRTNAPRRQTGVTLVLATVVVLGSLVAPLVLPGVDPAENTNGTGFSSGVNPVLSLGQNLRRDIEHTVLDYSTESGKAEYLRLVSLDDFSGADWAPGPFTLRRANSVDAIGPPPGLANDVKTTEETSFISVRGLTSPWLPLPYPTSGVGGLDGDWYWDSDGLAVKSPDRTARDEDYRATSQIVAPTPAQLSAAGTTVPANFTRFLKLPAGLPKVISNTATTVAGGGASNYEKALLLQSFFRDGDFVYSETAPVDAGYDGTGMKVLAAFLKAKAGYCIHFASAMAVMARSLGIPSRIAVGFLPGMRLADKVDGRTGYSVTSHDLHSWPELYFEGIGWTRFEPTVGRGAVPAYADLKLPDVPLPVNTAVAPTEPSVAPAPSTKSTPLTQGPGAQNGPNRSVSSPVGPWLWLVFAVIVALLLLLLPALLRSLTCRRRLAALRAGSGNALVAWSEVLQTAGDLGLVIPDTATPRDAARQLDDAVGAGGEARNESLARLRVAVERESYSAAATAAATGAVSASPGSGRTGDYADAAVDTERIIAALRSASVRPVRLRATLFPPSIWSRVLERINRD